MWDDFWFDLIDATKAFLGWWIGYAFVLRCLVLTLWPAGCIIMAIGLEGDGDGYWNNHPFLGNLTTSAVGACFGIPFALIIIQYLLDQQSQLTERRQALAVYFQLVDELSSVADRNANYFSRNRIEDCRKKLVWVEDNLRSATRDDLVEFLRVLDIYFLFAFSGSDSNATLARSVDIYKSTWIILRTDVKLRLAGAGIPWLMTPKKGVNGIVIKKELKSIESTLSKIKKLRRASRDVGKIYAAAVRISSPRDEGSEANVASLIDATATIAANALKCLDAADSFVLGWSRIADQTRMMRRAYVEYSRPKRKPKIRY